MYPPSVEYIQADSLDHAISLLEEFNDSAHLLAGGQSLVPLLKFRLAIPDVIIDISQIPVDSPITKNDEEIKCHALATHDTVHSSDELGTFDVLRDALPQLADPQVRNMGTIGGSLAEADPSGDWGPLLFLMGGVIDTQSPGETREIQPSVFFNGPFQTKLDDNEMITGVRIPIPTGNPGGAYMKLKRRQGVYATASVGAHLELKEDMTIRVLRLTASAIQSSYACADFSETLQDKALSEDRVQEITQTFAQSLEPVDDTRGSASFKRNLCKKLGERAVTIAVKRAQGESVSPDIMEVA